MRKSWRIVYVAKFRKKWRCGGDIRLGKRKANWMYKKSLKESEFFE